MNATVRLLAVGCVASLATQALAQLPRPWDGGGGNNNWTTAANWADDIYPSGSFGDFAVIDNGATVVINSNLASTIPSPDSPPGGLNVSNNSALQVTGSGAFSTDISGGGVTGATSFTTGGTLTVQGAAASYTAPSLTFAGGGVFNPSITSASQGLVSISGNLTAGGGVLRPTFGFSPAAQSWVLADAGSITGSFTLDTSAVTLPLGRTLTTSVASGGVNGNQLLLNLKSVLVLNVNADTGAVTINNPAGGSTVVTGYSVGSTTNSLNTAGWSSLTTQLGAGWHVAGTPTSSRIDELGGPIPPANSSQASVTITATQRTLGNLLKPATTFQSVPNLNFEYITNTGEYVQGVVNVTGLNAVNNLLLTVNPTTGLAELKNSSTSTVRLRGYTISSQSGSLKAGAGDWSSLDDQGVTGIEEANGSASFLSELIPSVADTLVLAPGATYQMGDLFNAAGTRDLQLQFLMSDAALPGDFNTNGVVDAADYTVWRDNLSGQFTPADYDLWANNYGRSGFPTTASVKTGVVRYDTVPSSTSTAVAVPEPIAGCLLGAPLLALAFRRRR
jgi:hypothetical protein